MEYHVHSGKVISGAVQLLSVKIYRYLALLLQHASSNEPDPQVGSIKLILVWFSRWLLFSPVLLKLPVGYKIHPAFFTGT